MKLLGLDFDNTLVSYDKLFKELAIEKGLIDPSKCPNSKAAIRDYLRKEDKENEFTLLQGEVYGSRILEAEPTKGMLDALKMVKNDDTKIIIVSHKTEYPYKGPKYRLREAALNWLDHNGFFKKEEIGISEEDVYFESTKELKVKRIEDTGCTHYVDDLIEILMAIKGRTQRIWYSETNSTRIEGNITKMENWSKLHEIIKK